MSLGAAILWGGGDFAGGMGVKAVGGSFQGALRFLLAAHLLSLLALSGFLLLLHAPLPAIGPLLWGLGAGVAAGLSLTAFYVALSRGGMGVSAALSGLLAAAIPAAVSCFLDGAPGALRLLGFAAAAVAIWLIASTPSQQATDRVTFLLAIAGGLGFGLYFVALRFANAAGVLEPMALARVGSLCTCGLLLLVGTFLGHNPTSVAAFRGEPADDGGLGWISGPAWLWACGVAALDTGGNLLFLAATRLERLDSAAVLSSLYPASTILLAAWFLHERPARHQIYGMGLALFAVMLITV